MEELIWVRVETTKANDSVWSYKGQILKAVFDGIVSNQLNVGYFKLHRVYWVMPEYDDNGNEAGETLLQYGKGDFFAYAGDLYLKIEHLVGIAPIDGDIELAKYADKDKNQLSVVVPIRS